MKRPLALIDEDDESGVTNDSSSVKIKEEDGKNRSNNNMSSSAATTEMGSPTNGGGGGQNNNDKRSTPTTPSPPPTNPQQVVDLDSDPTKKLKLTRDPGPRPSRVVHIRNIPSDVTETEIVHLGIPFGRVSNVLVLKGKNQAFLELADEHASVAMVSYFNNCAAQLRGRSVYVQYSTHKELKTDGSHSNANSAAQAALAAAQALTTTTTTTPPNSSSNNQNSTPHELVQGGPNTVLRVIIEQMLYPVTLDVLYQIFSRVGKVLRIVTFTKSGFFQALIQYPDVVMAQAAKLTLDGQNIYNGCCTLRIEYSKLGSLNVRYNNDKSRDYTNPNLPTGEAGTDFPGAGGQLGASAFGNGFSLNGGGNSIGGIAAALQQVQGMYGPLAAAAAAAAANNPHHHHHHHPHGPHSFQSPRNLLAAAAAAAAAASAVGSNNNNLLPGCVLLVSNLNEELITPDGLFTLFGVYGDVQRVKILFNKKDSALVQMREPSQAQLALTYLDRLRLFNKPLRVTISKHVTVQMPKEGQPDAGLTKDYTSSPLHRFKKPDSKNYANIYAPSSTLHLSNIPTTVKDEEITEAFTEGGFSVKGVKFFPSKERRMALLQLNTLDEAVEALIKMHNYQLRENSHLRVSFSKSTI